MQLSELMAAAQGDATGVTIDVPDTWLQGRSVFGGLQAAVAVAAMRRALPDPVPLRTLQMTFIAPVPAGAVSASATVLRQGKSATHVEARLERDGEVLAHVIGVFGQARASSVRRDVAPVSAVNGEGRLFPYIEGLTPRFMQHFQARLRQGGFPFSGSREPRQAYTLALRDQGASTEAHVLALADFVPPVALSLLASPSPGSSLTWMLELLVDTLDGLPLEGWQAESDMVAARDGYTSQSTILYAPGGEAVALSRQSMVVFA
ncbi:thioesterase family protein [Tahibacter amnicola]|uniref:Thioesterase family protein n=1 Tax=Tahibacter amnicola TaxID=2976241 RepID=A0ABY6BD06_9GAMM|nr:thioesterase family protein [Tahibacter amnicola]UXI67739.1 thioesterase family protein [Tahibacter amnicola]